MENTYLNQAVVIHDMQCVAFEFWRYGELEHSTLLNYEHPEY